MTGSILVFACAVIVFAAPWRQSTLFRLTLSAERQTPNAPRRTVHALAIELHIHPLSVVRADGKVHASDTLAARPIAAKATFSTCAKETISTGRFACIQDISRDWLSRVTTVEFSFEDMLEALRQQLEDGRQYHATDAIDQ